MQWNSNALAAALWLKSCQVWTKMWTCPTWKGRAIILIMYQFQSLKMWEIEHSPNPRVLFLLSQIYGWYYAFFSFAFSIPIYNDFVQMIFRVSFQYSYTFSGALTQSHWVSWTWPIQHQLDERCNIMEYFSLNSMSLPLSWKAFINNWLGGIDHPHSDCHFSGISHVPLRRYRRLPRPSPIFTVFSYLEVRRSLEMTTKFRRC